MKLPTVLVDPALFCCGGTTRSIGELLALPELLWEQRYRHLDGRGLPRLVRHVNFKTLFMENRRHRIRIRSLINFADRVSKMADVPRDRLIVRVLPEHRLNRMLEIVGLRKPQQQKSMLLRETASIGQEPILGVKGESIAARPRKLTVRRKLLKFH